MQSSNIPSKIPLPFGYAAGSGYINTIPAASQIGIANGRASLHDGFPPDTFIPIPAGGVPPWGGDFNGILNEITAIQQWQEAGGFFPFDASFAATVGGYPAGAILQSSTFQGLWLNTTENNSTNPDANGGGWIPLVFNGESSFAISSPSFVVSSTQAARPIINVTGFLSAATTLIMPPFVGSWIISNNTTGNTSLTIKTATGTGVPLTQGQITYVYSDGVSFNYADSAKVSSFNGRVGSISLNATDVTNALGYTPLQYGIGFNGQVWYDRTSIRTLGALYTNATANTMVVNVTVGTSDSSEIRGYVNGVYCLGATATNSVFSRGNGTLIVPPGGNYAVTATGSWQLIDWSELTS